MKVSSAFVSVVFFAAISFYSFTSFSVTATYWHFSGNGCQIEPTDINVDHELSAYGFENSDPTDDLYVYCPINYMWEWKESATTYEARIDASSQVSLLVRVLDNNSGDAFSCRVYGSDGTEGTSYFFDYDRTAAETSITNFDPMSINFDVDATFSGTGDDYYFLYCKIPEDETQYSQLIGYYLSVYNG